MTSSSVESLERESEASRARIAELLNELRSRVSPGDVVEQVVDFATDGGAADFIGNLSRQVRSNPLPCVLIGAGFAWLMMREGGYADRGEAGGHVRHVAGAAQQAAGEGLHDVQRAAAAAGDAASRTAGRASDAVSGVAARAGEALSEAGLSAVHATRNVSAATQAVAGMAVDAAADAASAASESLQGAAASVRRTATGAAGALGGSATDLGATLLRVAREQPLIVAGFGLAIGAVIGAVLPATESENRLMGDYSDQMKERARATAARQVDKARDVTAQTYETAKDAAAEVVDTAAQAAREQGLPVGTLRAEHAREHESQGSREGLTGSMMERPEGEAVRDAVPHSGREGFGDGQEDDHSRSRRPNP